MKGLVKGKPMFACMTATADEVEDYNLIEMIKITFNIMLIILKSLISALATQGLMEKGISKQILFGILPRVLKGPLTD